MEWILLNYVLLIQIISTIILGFLFMMFKEFEDESVRSNWKKPLKFLFWTFSVEWLNINQSSGNKWAHDANGNLIPYTKRWYHFGVKPKYKEAFPFSSTILVGFTDGEHTFQKHQLNAIFGLLFIWNWMAGIATFVGIYSFTFIKEKWLKNIN